MNDNRLYPIPNLFAREGEGVWVLDHPVYSINWTFFFRYSDIREWLFPYSDIWSPYSSPHSFYNVSAYVVSDAGLDLPSNNFSAIPALKQVRKRLSKNKK